MKSKKANKAVQPDDKPRMHERNKHHNPYDFPTLITQIPELEPFVKEGRAGLQTIDFANATAVKLLNKAILKADYGIAHWDIPENYLCPPIPGRSDYLHYLADILRNSNYGKIPKGHNIKGLDIGVGANCIYPLLGHQLYG
ncbi:MAG: RlmF-related methyltransferase, partial [Salinivirgaceae bacterium]